MCECEFCGVMRDDLMIIQSKERNSRGLAKPSQTCYNIFNVKYIHKVALNTN